MFTCTLAYSSFISFSGEWRIAAICFFVSSGRAALRLSYTRTVEGDVDPMVLTVIQWLPPEWRICTISSRMISKWSDWTKIGFCKPLMCWRSGSSLISCCTTWIWESLSHSPIFVLPRQLCVPDLDPVIPIITCNNDINYSIIIDRVDNNHFETYLLDHFHHHLWSPGACTGVCI